eukprot:gene2640-2679_t
MRLSRTAVAFATLASLSSGAYAQTAPAPAAPAAAAPARPADPVLAKVNGSEIRMSDLAVIAQNLPEEARQLPPAQLYPQLLDQAIDGKALVALAKKEKLDTQPDVARAMTLSAERTLQSALVSREVGPSVEEAKAHDELRQAMISEGIGKLLANARTQVKVERFNPDGAPAKATDAATPPAPQAKPPVKK